jgi:hypothetical protein
MTPESLNRSLGQYGRHAKAELHALALGAMVVIEDILAGRVRKRGVWWERVR